MQVCYQVYLCPAIGKRDAARDKTVRLSDADARHAATDRRKFIAIVGVSDVGQQYLGAVKHAQDADQLVSLHFQQRTCGLNFRDETHIHAIKQPMCC